MDFWSRLIGGSRSLSTKSLRASSPTERLTAFKRTCNTLQQIWRSGNLPPGETTANARNCIDRLNSILSDESRGPAPHPCMAYASSSQVFVTVTKLVLMSYDYALVRSATVFFNTLIDAEVDGVVDNRIFARALVDLVRRTDRRSEDVEGRLMELLFGVANNIRLQPGILSAWFAPRSSGPGAEDQMAGLEKEFEGATRKDDFPLFYLLVDYVHHGGHAGDFARTGLLYLIETASRSKDLERWLIESDLATLMATGLGALYSQLGSLSFGTTEENVPPIIALSDHASQDTAVRPYLGASMGSFMSYLLFWQDAIDHCRSAEVNATLLDHFQVLFLEQLLYPSLLESSDVEGGSTAAVFTYLYRILASIDQSDMVNRILRFLLASPSNDKPTKKKTHMSISRRKSLDFLAAFAQEADKPSPSLFNLRDLVLLGLQSANRQTILATLRLLSVVLQRHPSFARSLIRTVPGQAAKQRTVGAMNTELQQILSLASSMVHDPKVDNSYDNYLRDATYVLESRLCIQLSEDDPDDTTNLPLELKQDDPILRELVTCLEDFFANSVIVNLALTEVLMSIVSSHLVSLDGWVLVDPAKYKYANTTPSETSESNTFAGDILERIRLAYEEPSWSPADTPTLTSVLRTLVEQTKGWKDEIPDFDILVAARRDLLHREDSSTPIRSRQPSEPPTRSSSRQPQMRPANPGSDIGSPRGRTPRPQDTDISPSLRAAMSSPLRDPSTYSTSRDSSSSQAITADELQKRLAMPIQVAGPESASAHAEAQPEANQSASEDDAVIDEKPETATLGHVLINVVILYEFLLELSAMVQVRGSLFEEAGFPIDDLEIDQAHT